MNYAVEVKEIQFRLLPMALVIFCGTWQKITIASEARGNKILPTAGVIHEQT